MRKRMYTYLGVTAAMAMLAVIPAAPAMAATGGVLTVGSLGGTNVNVGDALKAPLSGSAVLTTSSGTLTCTGGSFSSKDKTNPAASTGTATETVTAIAFTASTCTSTISGTTSVASIGLKKGTAPVATVTVSTMKMTVKPIVAVVLNTVLGPVSCFYGGSVSGTLSNTNNSLSFSSAKVTRQSGSSSLCPASGTYTAAYQPITDTTQAAQKVFVN